MKIFLPVLAGLAMAALTQPAIAQFGSRIIEGKPYDSSVISFSDTLASISPAGFSTFLDTSQSGLWQTGATTKQFFSAGASLRPGIMTDTASAYPINANASFGVKVTRVAGLSNLIVSFTHKYQTPLRKDGGIVEYSFDSLSWNNVVGGCYAMMPVDSFYSATDTLFNGKPGFSGTGMWKRSRFQFFQGLPIKASGSCPIKFPLWIRFRFVSDSVADTLAGWIIRDVKIKEDQYSGAVGSVRRLPQLGVHPNPANADYIFWPALAGESKFSLTITDALGHAIYRGAYLSKTRIMEWSPGVYFYFVTDGETAYGGTIEKR